jgi:hypothetical protein
VRYVDVGSFVNVLFKDRGTADKLAPLISNVERVVSEVEFELVRRGYRECDIYHVYPETMYEGLRRVYEANLKFKVIDVVKRFEGFAHKHEKPSRPEEILYYGAVCRSDRSLEEMVRAHARGDHDRIGELLGYPDCDRRFFVEWWGKGWLDLVYPTALNTEDAIIDSTRNYVEVEYHPYTLTTMRYAGIRVIPYFSHSFKCPKSIKFGETVVELAREIGGDSLVEGLLWLLSLEHTWSQYNGIIEVNTGYFKIIAGGWTDVKLTVRLKPIQVKPI